MTNIIGKRFSSLVAVSKNSDGNKYQCLCDCGKTTYVFRANLVSSHTKSCGCANKGREIQDKTGKRFGKLTVISMSPERKQNRVTWECLCDCGNKTLATSNGLQSMRTKSCGCTRSQLISEAKTKHGHSSRVRGKSVATTEYMIWAGIKTRCLNKKSRPYKDYGARGITICDGWKNSFEQFISDMGLRPSKSHSIERLDNNGPYDPENCIWATSTKQANNKRNNHMLECYGKTQSVSDWARETGILATTLIMRIRAGWSSEKAISTPVKT